jgi:hypothetical protein
MPPAHGQTHISSSVNNVGGDPVAVPLNANFKSHAGESALLFGNILRKNVIHCGGWGKFEET